MELFRRLRPRRPPKSPVREALRKMQEDQQRKQQEQTVLNDIHPQLTKCERWRFSFRSMFSLLFLFFLRLLL